MSDSSMTSRDRNGYHRGYRRGGNCWTRIGATVCLVISILINVLLAAVIVYLMRENRLLKRNMSTRKQVGSAALEIVDTFLGGGYE